MPVYETTIQSVVQRVVNTRDGRASTIYDITDGSGTKWSTWKQPIANEANRLVGQQVELTGREEINDRGYKNYTIDDVRAATGAQMRAANPVAQAQQAQPMAQAQPIPQAQSVQQQPIMRAGDEDPTQKDFRIARQTAAKVSAQLSTDPKDFWDNLDALTTYFIYALKPAEYQGGSAPQDPHVNEPNQFIPARAYADPGREAPPDTYDEGIPF